MWEKVAKPHQAGLADEGESVSFNIFGLAARPLIRPLRAHLLPQGEYLCLKSRGDWGPNSVFFDQCIDEDDELSHNGCNGAFEFLSLGHKPAVE